VSTIASEWHALQSNTEKTLQSSTVPFEVSSQHIREAAERIRSIVHRTPILASRGFDAESGFHVCFKCENFQRGGAFKIRGASNFILSMPAEQLGRGLVAYSSGNHAQAVAIAARHVGAKATLVMPSDAPRSKMEATRAQGATIVTYDRLKESREPIGNRIAAETGATLVPPFDHPRIIAGQGTTALELLEDVPELDALVAPVGGGGLLSGCAIAAKDINPNIRIFGAEPEEANDTFLSLAAGKIVEIPTPNTIADGLRSTHPGELTFSILQRLAESIVLVSEEQIKTTVKFLLSRLKILVEPSGAAAAAAVLHRKLPPDLRRVGVILSGGNMDLETLADL
jgi:threonine dehydratase